MSDTSDHDDQAIAEMLDDDALGQGRLDTDEVLGLPELLGRDTLTPGEDVPDSESERTVRERGGHEELPPDLLEGVIDDRTEGEPDYIADRGERDLDDLARLSEDEPARAEDPSPEAAAMHLVDDSEQRRRD